MCYTCNLGSFLSSSGPESEAKFVKNTYGMKKGKGLGLMNITNATEIKGPL